MQESSTVVAPSSFGGCFVILIIVIAFILPHVLLLLDASSSSSNTINNNNPPKQSVLQRDSVNNNNAAGNLEDDRGDLERRQDQENEHNIDSSALSQNDILDQKTTAARLQFQRQPQPQSPSFPSSKQDDKPSMAATTARPGTNSPLNTKTGLGDSSTNFDTPARNQTPTQQAILTTTNNSSSSGWRCACEGGFLPPGLLQTFGGAQAVMRMSAGQCYHKQS